MSRLVRATVALEVGERLKEIGKKVHCLPQFSGDALETQLAIIDSSIGAELGRLSSLIKSCRAGANSYPNYPALRRVLATAGDQVFEIQSELSDLRGNIDSDGQAPAQGNKLITLGQQLRLVAFVPNSDKEKP